MSPKPTSANPSDAGKTRKELAAELEKLRADNARLKNIIAGQQHIIDVRKALPRRDELEVRLECTDTLREELVENKRELQAANEDLEVHVEELSLQNEELLEAQDALRESEEKYRRIVEMANEGIWTLDRDNVTTFVNPQMARMLGYSPAEVVGRTPYEFLDDAYREDVRNHLNNRHRGAREQYTCKYLRKDGGDLWAIVSGTPLYDGNGAYAGAMAMITDITERMWAEEALKRSERNLAQAQSIARLGFWVWDVDEDVLTWSDETYRLFSLQPGELAPDYSTFMDFVHPEDREKVANAVQDALEGKRPYNVEWRFPGKDGSVSYFYSQGEVQRTNGRPSRMMGTILDITERKRAEEALRESEEKFRALADTSAAAIYVYQGENPVYVNRAAEKITGYSRDQLVSMKFWDIVHPDYRNIVRDRGLARQRGESFPSPYEIKIITKSGETRWLELSAGPIRYMGGPAGVATFFDITERKRAEEELAGAKAQVELYLDLMGHDINNMNQVSVGYLELALNELKEAGRIKDVELLEKSLRVIQDSSRLIDNVRKLRTVKSKEHPLQPIDLRSVLLGVRDQFSDVVGRQVTINYMPTEGRILANELVKDIFINIVGNAIKHSDPDKPLEVTITQLHAYGTDENFYKVMIEDNGPGIPDDLKTRLFSRFERGNTKAKGKGLGLYLVKTLVHGFGGKIWVEDRIRGDPSQGARFVVLLPAAEK